MNRALRTVARSAAFVLGLAALALAARADEHPVCRPTDEGAKADGVTLDTRAIQRAIERCAAKGGGTVTLTPGRYRSGTLRLRSRVALEVQAGATLVGSSNWRDYEPVRPGPRPVGDRYDTSGERWHTGLVIADRASDVEVRGPGTIDGSRVADPQGEEDGLRGAHTVLVVDSEDVRVRDVTVRDSGNYAFLVLGSRRLSFDDVRVTGGWDGIHLRGAQEVRIRRCDVRTGDDAIAGADWEDLAIEDSALNSACNGIRIIGPAHHVRVERTRIFGPGEAEHRTAPGRFNTLAAINIAPGGWYPVDGVVDDVVVRDVRIDRVRSALWLRAMSPGARIGRVVLEDVTGERLGRVPAAIEGRPGQPVETVFLRRVSLQSEGGGRAGTPGPPSPQVDPWDPLPFWGFVARHVRRLAFEDVRLSLAAADARPMALLDDVGTLTWSKAGVPPGEAGRVIAASVERVDAPGVDVRREPIVDAKTSVPLVPTGLVAPPLVTFAGTSASFAQDGDTVWVKAKGAAPLATADEYGAVYRKAALGPGQRVSVRVTKTDPGTGVIREAMGLIVRNDVAAPRKAVGYVVLTAFASNGVAMQWDADGDGKLDGHSPMDGYSEWPCWLRIERRGTRFTGLSSTDGERWTTVGSVDLPSAAPLQDAGVFVTRMASAFDGLRVEPLP